MSERGVAAPVAEPWARPPDEVLRALAVAPLPTWGNGGGASA